MALQLQTSEAAVPDQQAVLSVLKYLRTKNLKASEQALRKELGLPTDEDLPDNLPAEMPSLLARRSGTEPAKYEESYASHPPASSTSTEAHFQPALSPAHSPSPPPSPSPSPMGSTDTPVSLGEEKRSFSWPGSLPYYHLKLPIAPAHPSPLMPLKPLTPKEPSRQSPHMVPLGSAATTPSSPKTPLWSNTSMTSPASASTATQQPTGAFTFSMAPTTRPTLGIQHLPVGAPLLYQVASAQGYGIQSPLVTPLLTLLPTGVMNQQPASSTPTISSPQLYLKPTQGLSVVAQGKVPNIAPLGAVKPPPVPLPKVYSVTSTTGGVIRPTAEPSTGQTMTSPLTEPTQVSFSALSPPRTLASIPPAEMTSAYAELKAFAEEFKTKRIRLGYTQGAVGQSLADKGYSNFAQSTISRFEQMQLSPTNAAAIKQVLERWLEEAESPSSASSSSNTCPAMASRKRKKRAVFTPQTRSCMEEFFRQNPRPNRQLIESVAQQLDLLPEEVRVWFCNKRQKEKQQQNLQMVYNDRDAALSSGTTSPTSFYDPTLKKRSPSPKTNFTIEELSKSSASSITSSPVHLTSPFALSPIGAMTTTNSQKVFPMLVTPGSSTLSSMSPFLNSLPIVTNTKA